MMKTFGLLLVGAFILASCDATPKGNKSIYPVVHDEPVEKVDEHAGHDHANHDHAGHDHATETTTEVVESAAVETEVAAPQDSAK